MRAGASAIGTPIVLPSLPGMSRRASTQAFFSMSFGPSSTRTGTPRSSHSAKRWPGMFLVSLSIFTTIG